MNTEQLIAMLATQPETAPDSARRRFAIAIGLGALGAALLMAIFLGVRHDLAAAVRLPAFWGKVVFAACLAAGSLLVTVRLSRPGVRLAWALGALAVPVAAVWLFAAIALAHAAPGERVELMLGQTWRSCPLLIAMLSAPVFVAVLWAMQGLAPTRLRLAGAAAGLLAGTTGALVYTLHCPELAAPFVGTWYLLGMLIPALAGAVAGPRVLRW
ncbi:MAG TPA: DUF1109 domain-containing protein [Burkholderiales bacterium]|nr:DUF1109 domain-containing protein [Burkholderiales bacterium]